MKMLWLVSMVMPLISAGPAPAPEAVTFNRDIAPILFEHCAPCHRPGEAAPFPLLTYADARRHATQLVSVTQSRYMPPWPPAAQTDAFSGDRHLAQKQIDLIRAWVRSGAPEGDAGQKPSPPLFTEGWQLGQPDLVVQVPKPFQLPADGKDVFRNFVIPAGVAKTVYVRAIEIRPGDRRLVHHANLVLDRTRSLRRRDGADGQPGFPGMDITTESGDNFEPDSHFLFWKPGGVPEPEPAGMAWRLDPDTDLILNLHLQPSGKPEQLQPTVGLYYSSAPPTRFPMLLQLEHDGAIDIPAESNRFQVTDHLTLPMDVDLYQIYPHAHYLGKHVEAWAKLPDGSRRTLIQIRDWNLNWQAVYTYRKPVHLPKGTVIEMQISFDNTAANSRNPRNPPEHVRSGDRSTDEMGHVWLQVLPSQKDTAQDSRMILQEAVMRRRLEKYPADFAAHYNLGALAESSARHVEAIGHFEAALHVDPAHAAARNALASAFAADGKNEQALQQWQRTIRMQPDYAMAHFNLARLLTGLGREMDAIAEYQTYLRQEPDDPQAHLNLGALYIQLGRFPEALPEYGRVAQLKPDDADVLTNLGTLLAKSGDLPAAIQAFARALVLEPANTIAQANLKRARAAQRP